MMTVGIPPKLDPFYAMVMQPGDRFRLFEYQIPMASWEPPKPLRVVERIHFARHSCIISGWGEPTDIWLGPAEFTELSGLLFRWNVARDMTVQGGKLIEYMGMKVRASRDPGVRCGLSIGA